jgi:uncharacterized protein (DUF58 family)
VEAVSFDDAFVRRLERLSLKVRRATGAAGGRPGTRRTPAEDFIDHRPYSPGDDQRHIDWHALARHDEVFVKVGQVPQAADVHLVLDLSPSMVVLPAKRRLAVELTAALGWISLALGDRVSVGVLPEVAGLAGWGPATGVGANRRLLAYLEALPAATGGASALAPVVRRVARAAPVGGLAVLVSDLWLADDLEVALAGLPAPRWEVLVLQVLDRAELEPDVEGALELVDVESGLGVTLRVDEVVREAYRRQLCERVERTHRVAAARGAAYVLLPADWSLERAIVPALQRRAILVS